MRVSKYYSIRFARTPPAHSPTCRVTWRCKGGFGRFWGTLGGQVGVQKGVPMRFPKRNERGRLALLRFGVPRAQIDAKTGPWKLIRTVLNNEIFRDPSSERFRWKSGVQFEVIFSHQIVKMWVRKGSFEFSFVAGPSFDMKNGWPKGARKR